MNIPFPAERQFISDNCAPVCPEAWEAMREANAGHAPSYGDDAWTCRARRLFQELFETDCEVFFTFNGTASNGLALAALCRSYQAVICHELAHIHTDECGAAGFFTQGAKILAVAGAQGRLDAKQVRAAALLRTDVHFPLPGALSITQSTELGTVYRAAELRGLCEVAQECRLSVHMDGARFANACAALGAAPKELSWQQGVDVLTFGGAKIGLGVGEAILFFRKELAQEFARRQLQAGQVASKMRYLAAPWVGMLESGAWLRNARHANACAARLAGLLSRAPGLEFLAPTEANAVFVRLPQEVAHGLRQRGWQFLTFAEHGGARLMCAWDHTFADVDRLASDILAFCQERVTT
jgi:threonine aldolase